MLAHRNQSNFWSDEGLDYYGAQSGPLVPDGLSTSFHSEMNRQWQDRIDDLIHIRSLHDNWDGEGAVAPQPELVDSLELFFGYIRAGDFLPPPSRIAASNQGTVVVEWQLENGHYLEAECDQPFHADWMSEVPNEPPLHWEESWRPLSNQHISTARLYRAA